MAERACSFLSFYCTPSSPVKLTISPLCVFSKGDGTNYPRNPKADELLGRLASELVDADKIN